MPNGITTQTLPKKAASAIRLRNFYLNAIAAMLPLCFMHVLLPTGNNNTVFDTFLNSAGQFYMTAVFIVLAFRLLLEEPDTIWTPLFWLPLQCGAFFGFGPLVEVFGNEFTQAHLSKNVLNVSSGQLSRANALSVIGATGVLIGLFAYMKFSPSAWRKTLGIGASERANTDGLKVAALAFVVGGLLLKYGYVIPALHSGSVVPGVLNKMTAAVDAGYAMMTYLIFARKDPLFALIFALTFPVHVFLSLLSFSKSTVIIALLLPVLGAHLARPKFKRLLLSFLLIGAIYTSLQPYVVFGRNSSIAMTGGINSASYMQRWDISIDFLINGSDLVSTEREQRQDWWTRLSFVGQQNFAIELYDNGQPGDTIDNIWMYFIPRVIWPDKPILYAPGLQFYSIVTLSDRRSFMPATVFGDLYWQYGWSGVFVGSVLVGALFGFLSSVCLRIVRRRQLVMLPVLAIIVEMSANSLSKFVINGIISPLPLLAFYFFVFKVLINLRFKKQS